MSIDEAVMPQHLARPTRLRDLGLLDHTAAPDFDRLARLAARVLHVPIVLISLVESDRQFIISSIGLPQPWPSLCEFLLGDLPCRYIARSGAPLIITDVRAEPLLRGSPAITELGIVAYAGVPLTEADGRTLGALCAIDRAPRTWIADEIATLRDLAESAMTEIKLRDSNAERWQIEQVLRHSQQELADFFESGPIGLHWVDPDGAIFWANQAELDLLGYTWEEYVGHQIGEFHADQEASDDILQRLRRNETIRNYEARLRCKDGSIKYVQIDSNVLWEDGDFIHTRCFTRDITERKRADAALRESNSRLMTLTDQLSRSRNLLRTLFDGLGDGLALLDSYGVVLAINQALAALLDDTPTAIVGQLWMDLCFRASVPFPGRFALQTIHDGRQRRRRNHYEPPGGKQRALDMQALPLLGMEGQVEQVIVHVADITEKLELEAIAIQSERFAASGKLAATIAHELNTPLQSIKSCLYLAGNAGEARRENYLELAREELDRVSTILRQMLDLHRPSSGERQPIDLVALVERVLILTGSTLAQHGIAVERDLAPAPPLLGRADQLTQVLLNLILNAVDAMPDGGTLRITTRTENREPRTENRELGAGCRELGAENQEPGTQNMEALGDYTTERQEPPFLILEIADTGTGMSPEAQARIFDPFFTTKPQGSGLGLPISQKIIVQHNGQISVQSVPGGGSTFTITLPLAG